MDLRFVLPEIYGPQDSPTNRYESHDGPLENKRGGPSGFAKMRSTREGASQGKQIPAVVVGLH